MARQIDSENSAPSEKQAPAECDDNRNPGATDDRHDSDYPSHRRGQVPLNTGEISPANDTADQGRKEQDTGGFRAVVAPIDRDQRG